MGDTTPKPLSEVNALPTSDSQLESLQGLLVDKNEEIDVWKQMFESQGKRYDALLATTKALREVLKLARKTIVRGKKAMNKLEWEPGLTDAEWISETSGVLVQIGTALGDTK